jgi:hypothetical protein
MYFYRLQINWELKKKMILPEGSIPKVKGFFLQIYLVLPAAIWPWVLLN